MLPARTQPGNAAEWHRSKELPACRKREPTRKMIWPRLGPSQAREPICAASGSLGMKIGIHFGNVAWFSIGAKIHRSHKIAESIAK